MATNKKITQLDELTPATWADDDVIAIVDISAQETKKIQLSTFRGAVTGVSTLNASTPLTVDSATGDVTISVAINGGGTINAVFDEDNMASNSPTALATQQSIKAYVDSQVGTVDTLAEILANGNTSGGTNIVVSSGDVITTNTINETTAASGVTIDGVLVKDGQVDGRDVSVDGTKLDTVETSADVTDATNVLAALVGQEVVATGFTGTLDGVLGGGTPAAITGTALTLTTGATVTTVLDEDNMASNSATALSTQQSIKAYVDSQVGTADTLSEVLALGNTTGGTDIAMTGGDKITNFESTGINDDATSTAITIDSSGNLTMAATQGPALMNEDASNTNPTLIPRKTDTGTGWGSNGANNLEGIVGSVRSVLFGSGVTAFYASGGSEVARIDRSSGNVGIGTSSSANKLEVNGAIVALGAVTAYTNTGLYLQNKGSSVFDVGAWRSGASVAELTFSTDSGSDASPVEAMRIDSSGNVGIGTTAPSEKLEVTGNIILDATDADIKLKSGGAGTTGALRWTFSTNSTSYGDISLPYDTRASVGLLLHTIGGYPITIDTGNSVIFKEDNIETMRIAANGNVGIGTASPDRLFEVEEASGDAYIRFRASDTGGGADTIFENLVADNGQSNYIYFGDLDDVNIGIIRYSHASDFMSFTTNASESMRIDNSGNVGIATTSSVGSNSTSQGFWFDENEAARFSRASNLCSILNRITTTGTVQSLRYNGAQVGSISVTASATAYNTSSDYRLKENVVNLSGAIDRVKLLKPSRFNFIADPDTTVDGFVAHEVSDIVPEAVHGEKDAVDADGNPEYQGIDQSKLVPLLTAALKEALTKIDSLETRITALEG